MMQIVNKEIFSWYNVRAMLEIGAEYHVRAVTSCGACNLAEGNGGASRRRPEIVLAKCIKSQAWRM